MNSDTTKKKKQFRKSPGEYASDQATFSRLHKDWRKWSFQNKRGFFPVFTPEFLKLMPKISGNAIKLYLYLGSHINNQEGSTTVTIDTISKDLNATKRTVHNWFQELKENRLAIRIQPGFKQTTTTYLLPYHEDFLQRVPSVYLDLIQEFSSATDLTEDHDDVF